MGPCWWQYCAGLRAAAGERRGIESAWNSFALQHKELPFNQVIPTAVKNGYVLPQGFSLNDTLLMLPWVFFVVGYAQGSAQIGGEVKRASRKSHYLLYFDWDLS